MFCIEPSPSASKSALVFADALKFIEKVATPRPSASPFIVDDAPPAVLPLPSLMNAKEFEVATIANIAIKVFIEISLPLWDSSSKILVNDYLLIDTSIYQKGIRNQYFFAQK